MHKPHIDSRINIVSRRNVLIGLSIPFILPACTTPTVVTPTPQPGGVVVPPGTTKPPVIDFLDGAAKAQLDTFRQQNGLAGLTHDPAATRAASTHNDLMISKDSLQHEFDANSRLGVRLTNAGVNYSTAGENIAQGQITVEQVFQDWKNSPGHRANMLLNGINRFGIDETVDSSNRRWWTLILIG